MKIKTQDLTGAALDWAVVKADGVEDIDFVWPRLRDYSPSTNWSQGGPIIEREGITTGRRFAPKSPVVDWTAQYFQAPHSALEVHRQYGPTPLIAAMRCFVASQLGDEVEIPEELRG